jgi:hypothetical protein
MFVSRLAIVCLFMSAAAQVRIRTTDDEAYNSGQRVNARAKSYKQTKQNKVPAAPQKLTKGPKNPKVQKYMASKTPKSIKKVGEVTKQAKSSKSKKTRAPTNAPVLPPVVQLVPTLQSGSSSVTVIITTDDYPEETSFQITNQNGQTFMAGGGYTGKRTTYTDTKNLPDNIYTFIISDSYGDGICCSFGPGGYNVFANNVLVKAGGPFTDSETVTFSSQGAPFTPPTPTIINPPTTAPTDKPGACGSVTVIITTDNNPVETSYEVKDQNDNQVMSGNSYTGKGTTYTDSSCLPYGVYQFIIRDTKGNGVCCDFGTGGYNLFANDVLVKAGGRFTFSETIPFSSQGTPFTPPPLTPPTPTITNPPNTAPINPPTTAPINPPGACGTVTVIITTDNSPAETSYEVKDLNGNQVMSGNNYANTLTTYTDSSCLPYSVYEFIIRDTKGDGICCGFGNGGYNLFVNNVLEKAGGIFTFSETIPFSSQGTPFTPPPLTPPTPTITNPPNAAPINPPTTAPTFPPGACGVVIVIITTDDNPAETSYEVKDQNGNQVMSGNSYTNPRTTYTDSSCLPYADSLNARQISSSVYEFIIRDTKGDGICCGFGAGGYNLYANGILEKAGGVFTFSETVLFSSQGVPFTPPPTTKAPTTKAPTIAPNLTISPILQTKSPTFSPTPQPTLAPISAPVVNPTNPPTIFRTPPPTNRPPTPAPSKAMAVVNTNKSSYIVREPVEVNFITTDNHPSDWIAIYTCGSNIQYDYDETGGGFSGSITWTTLDIGCYFPIYLSGLDDVVMAEGPQFNINADTTTSISTDQSSYTEGNPVVISYVNALPNSQDWVVIFDCNEQQINYEDTGGGSSGSITWNTLAVGCYTASLISGVDDFLLVTSPQFNILPDTVTSISTDKTNYAVGEPVIVTWANKNPTALDWVGIYTCVNFANVDYQDTNGALSGVFTFTDFVAGCYVAVLNDSNDIEIVYTPDFFVA